MAHKSRITKLKTQIHDNNDGYIGVIRGNSRVLYGQTSEQDDAILKSNRSDYGRVVDVRIPHGYHEQVKKAWEMYETDRLFRYLIDRCDDFAANGFEWEIPVERKSDWGTQLKEWLTRKVAFKPSKEEKERKVWNKWSATLNKSVPNILPGIDEVNKWIVKHLLLGGMAPLEWEWGNITVDGVDYKFPIRMTMHNPLSIILDRKNQAFIAEEMYLKLSPGVKNITETPKESSVGLGSITSRDPKIWHKINLMGTDKNAKSGGFALKYKWSPADNSALVYGRNVHVGQGLYPTPPFVGLYDVLTMRRALTAADIAILDGVINFIIDWEIGDATKLQTSPGKEVLPNQPRPAKYDSAGTKIEKSSIEMAKDIITSDTRGNVMQLFHPYYYKLSIKMPDPAVLLDTAKYTQSTVEIYQAFGILLSPADKRMDFTGINTQNFEQMLDNIRFFYLRRFWETLAAEIVERNQDKLTATPNMVPRPLNTKTEAFKTSLLNLAKIGKISTESLLQGYGLDKKVEIPRIAQEISSGEKALTDSQVPVSFVQSAKKPGDEGKDPMNPKDEVDAGDGEEDETTSVVTPLKQPGRPVKGQEKKR